MDTAAALLQAFLLPHLLFHCIPVPDETELGTAAALLQVSLLQQLQSDCWSDPGETALWALWQHFGKSPSCPIRSPPRSRRDRVGQCVSIPASHPAPSYSIKCGAVASSGHHVNCIYYVLNSILIFLHHGLVCALNSTGKDVYMYIRTYIPIVNDRVWDERDSHIAPSVATHSRNTPKMSCHFPFGF